MEITKNSIIGDVLDQYPDTAELFFSIGMPVSYTHLDVYKRQAY